MVSLLLSDADGKFYSLKLHLSKAEKSFHGQ